MRIIIAWIKKYILHVHSPSAHARGFDFEYDYLKSLKNKRIIELEKENAELSLRIADLEAQLEESRSKEGKGALETMIEGIKNISETLASDILGMLESAQDADCVDDCDFDCEHCEHARLEFDDDEEE